MYALCSFKLVFLICCASCDLLYCTAALMCLKKKKTYESQIEKLAGANMTIQTQLMAIEGANVSLQTLDVMNMGARIMKDLHKNMYVPTNFIYIVIHIIYSYTTLHRHIITPHLSLVVQHHCDTINYDLTHPHITTLY